MGKIEKALARARSSRRNLGDARPETDVPATPQAPRQRVAQGESGATRRLAGVSLPIDLSTVTHADLDNEHLEECRVISALPGGHGNTAPYKVLRTRVLQRMRANGWNSLGITGTGPGEGKTLTAINLAFSLAQEANQNVLLADLDLRRPSIHRVLGLEPRYSLSDCLKGSVDPEEVIINPGTDRLGILPNAVPIRDSSEMLSSPPMLDLVAKLTAPGMDQLVVFDLPPVLAADDVIAFAPHVDALLVVVAQSRTKRDDLAAAHELLREANVLGTVLNHSDEAAGNYYYYG